MKVEQTTAEVRVYLREYLRRFSAEIVTAADGVLAAEKELAVQEAALRLKAGGVTAMQGAVFQRDPLAALADAWALTAAMARFCDGGSGKELFGESQPLVVDALHRLEVQVDELAQTVVGKERVDVVRPEIHRFVRDNPIRDLTFGLPSAGLQASVVTAADWGTDARRSISQLDETARDASDRLTIYAEQLPQIARWQGEIVLIEVRREVLARPFASIEAIDGNIGAIERDIDALTGLATGTPKAIAAERAGLREALERERAAIFASLDGQRVATIAAFTAERQAILAAVEELRAASFSDLGNETTQGFDRMDQLSAATVQDLSRVSRDAIDHLFWRALELLLVGMAGFAVLGLARRGWRRRSDGG